LRGAALIFFVLRLAASTRGFGGCVRFLLPPCALGALLLADSLCLSSCGVSLGVRLDRGRVCSLRRTERLQQRRLALRNPFFCSDDRGRRLDGRQLVCRP